MAAVVTPSSVLGSAVQRRAEPAARALPLTGASHSVPMLQAKLTVNTPGDKYEQEADRVADRVLRMPEPRGEAASPPASSAGGRGEQNRQGIAWLGCGEKESSRCLRGPGTVRLVV